MEQVSCENTCSERGCSAPRFERYASAVLDWRDDKDYLGIDEPKSLVEHCIEWTT
jgi:hypothetical protein